ncbi:MAG TPA: hypothetical protein VLU25_03905 [Acidobacteriota bacterium]|nr:hypothetical protein [Acidobacteriota bacterium]
MKGKRRLFWACIALMAVAAALNLMDFFLEARQGGISGDLIKPLGLTIMFGGLAVSTYYKKLATPG